MSRLLWLSLAVVLALGPLSVRTACAEPRDGVTDQERIETLRRLLEQVTSADKTERSYAIRKLGRLRAPQALRPLAEALRDGDPQIRVLAVEALGELGDAGALPFLLEQLADPEPSVATATLRTLPRFENPSVLPALLAAMRHPAAGARDAAARALEGITHLPSGFDADARSEERERVIAAWETWWRKNGTRTPRDWWVEALASPESSTRLAAVSALRERGDLAIVPALLQALDDPAEAVRFQAGLALAELIHLTVKYDPYAVGDARSQGIARWNLWWLEHKDRSPEDWYREALKNRDPENAPNRAAAARELGRRRDAIAAVPDLLAALDDPAAPVRLRANEALETLTARTEGFGADRPPAERQEAAARWQAWWQRNAGKPRSEWWIDAILHDASPKNRTAAARSLGGVPEKSSVRFLLHALADPVAAVRAAASSSLRRLTAADLPFPADGGEDERQEAVRAWLAWWEEKGPTFEFKK